MAGILKYIFQGFVVFMTILIAPTKHHSAIFTLGKIAELVLFNYLNIQYETPALLLSYMSDSQKNLFF